MKDEEGFFYPHNVDFRGRAYPMHPHLNHLGSDVCRGILEFAEGRPLGKSGLHWLKIHSANLFAGGVDKLSHKGRIAFTENHLDDIFDSADRPLDGRRWWLNAEDPFQFLAACINLSEALRSSSPETTISHIPVHQVLLLTKSGLLFSIRTRAIHVMSLACFSRMVPAMVYSTTLPLEETRYWPSSFVTSYTLFLYMATHKGMMGAPRHVCVCVHCPSHPSQSFCLFW